MSHQTSTTRTGLRRLAALAAVAAAALSLSASAEAGVTAPDGGYADVSVRCDAVIGLNDARAMVYSSTRYTINYQFYVESASYPARSGWGAWQVLAPYTSGYAGSVARRGSGWVRIYVRYAMNGVVYGGYWLTFQNTGSAWCYV